MAYINLAQVMYPVGAIYASSNSTSPASLFSGTWSQLTGDACLMAGTSVGNVGSKTINVDQMPKHSHKISRGRPATPQDDIKDTSGKSWYQGLGSGTYTTVDGDFLYSSGGIKTKWREPIAGTLLEGGQITCLTPTDVICGEELLNPRGGQLWPTLILDKYSSQLEVLFTQQKISHLLQYMEEPGLVSQMVDLCGQWVLGIPLVEKQAIHSPLQKCQPILMLPQTIYIMGQLEQLLQFIVKLLAQEAGMKLLIHQALAIMPHITQSQFIVLVIATIEQLNNKEVK